MISREETQQMSKRIGVCLTGLTGDPLLTRHVAAFGSQLSKHRGRKHPHLTYSIINQMLEDSKKNTCSCICKKSCHVWGIRGGAHPSW